MIKETTNMDKKSIRPKLNINSSNSTVEEIFQNEVLRPIIKLQHELIIRYFNHTIHSKNVDFHRLNREAKLKFIKDCLTKDLSLNNYLKGLITGLLIGEEMVTYLNHKQSVNKRIIQIIEKRIVDSMEEVIGLER